MIKNPSNNCGRLLLSRDATCTRLGQQGQDVAASSLAQLAPGGSVLEVIKMCRWMRYVEQIHWYLVIYLVISGDIY